MSTVPRTIAKHFIWLKALATEFTSGIYQLTASTVAHNCQRKIYTSTKMFQLPKYFPVQNCFPVKKSWETATGLVFSWPRHTALLFILYWEIFFCSGDWENISVLGGNILFWGMYLCIRKLYSVLESTFLYWEMYCALTLVCYR